MSKCLSELARETESILLTFPSPSRSFSWGKDKSGADDTWYFRHTDSQPEMGTILTMVSEDGDRRAVETLQMNKVLRMLRRMVSKNYHYNNAKVRGTSHRTVHTDHKANVVIPILYKVRECFWGNLLRPVLEGMASPAYRSWRTCAELGVRFHGQDWNITDAQSWQKFLGDVDIRDFVETLLTIPFSLLPTLVYPDWNGNRADRAKILALLPKLVLSRPNFVMVMNVSCARQAGENREVVLKDLTEKVKALGLRLTSLYQDNGGYGFTIVEIRKE